ncbi:serum response factor-binding protein 1-like [Ylistrum balloti]|uniref:serum response factor-binding protein 1-like n=1 Tax=Ylistrum balloti TaxID=509963 RepID=UPI00290595F9|nr:serum response factor-binding protein 1-like [Ylistrum balloti]
MEEHEDETDKEKRTLDNALMASIDMVALNNKVVCMRSTAKKAKIYTIRKLKNRLKQLKDRKGSPEEIAKDRRRLNRFKEELHVIRHLKKDLISKYALGCTDTVHDLCKKQNDVAIEIRALTRLAEHKLMQLSIKKFREEHEDWKSLAAFLLTKQSGRRIKKQRGPTPIEKMITNVTTGQLMVKTYLQDKLERSVDLPKDKNIKKKKKIVEQDSMSDSEPDSTISNSDVVSKGTDHDDILSSKNLRKSPLKVSKLTKTKVEVSPSTVKKDKIKKVEVVKFNSKDLDGSESVPSFMEESTEKKNLVAQLRGISDEENHSESEMEHGENSKSDDSISEHEDSDELSGSGNSLPKTQNVEKVCGEMVVKKLELDDDVVDESFMTDRNVTVFNDEITTTTTKKPKSKKAIDSFFVRSDSGSEDGETGSEEDDGKEDEDYDDFSNELNETVGNPASKGKTALRSTFMYSLSNSKKKSKTHGTRGKSWEGPDRGEKSREVVVGANFIKVGAGEALMEIGDMATSIEMEVMERLLVVEDRTLTDKEEKTGNLPIKGLYHSMAHQRTSKKNQQMTVHFIRLGRQVRNERSKVESRPSRARKLNLMIKDQRLEIRLKSI